jgi:hypothetical protein
MFEELSEIRAICAELATKRDDLELGIKKLRSEFDALCEELQTKLDGFATRLHAQALENSNHHRALTIIAAALSATLVALIIKAFG